MADYIKSTNFAVKDTLTTGDPAKIVKGTEIDGELVNVAAAIASKLDANSPTLTGTPLAPTASTATNNTQIATTAYVVNRIAQDIVAPLALKANLASPTFTGTVTVPTVIIGTQTNKATISYTTDVARTLTVPAVSGNRTFAFIDEAQTFTANQTFTSNQTIAANLIMSGNARRIQANFDAATLTDRTYFQTSTNNGTTSVGAIPSGTAQGCSFIVNNNSNPTNATFTAIYVDDDECSLNGSVWGSGSYLPLYIYNGGGSRIIVNPTGEVGVNITPTNTTTSLTVAGNGRTYSLKANARVQFSESYSYTVGATNRTLYIDSSGDIGGLSSTRESKANITPVHNTDWLMSLEPVSYNRRKKDSKGHYTEEVNSNTEFGLIADDVANIRPDICVFVDGKVSGINYEQLISPMLKEIQNLRAEVNALKEKVNG